MALPARRKHGHPFASVSLVTSMEACSSSQLTHCAYCLLASMKARLAATASPLSVSPPYMGFSCRFFAAVIASSASETRCSAIASQGMPLEREGWDLRQVPGPASAGQCRRRQMTVHQE